MTRLQVDVAIVGAGPAGLAAAEAAAAAGLKVVLIDENPRIGGQISRLPYSGAPTPREASLLEKVQYLGQGVCFGRGKHGILWVSHRGTTVGIEARATVMATGARERVFPVEGWERLGVMTAGAAQTLIKGSGSFPFRRVVVAGSGPLLLATAAQLLRSGVDVAAVVDSAYPRPRHWRHGLDILWGGSILLQGTGYLARILSRRVPILFGSAVTRIDGPTANTGSVSAVQIDRIGPDGSPVPGRSIGLECDAVLLSQGFGSAVELVAQSGAELEWNTQSMTWQPIRTSDFQTTVEGLYAVGDCAGIGGSQLSELEGELVGLALARRLGANTRRRATIRSRWLAGRLRAINRFRRGMDGIFPPPIAAPVAPLAATIACRCQEVTVGEIRDALDLGASTPAGVKMWTRAGMGACQGRTCDHIIDSLLREHAPATARRPPRPQFPVRPVPGVQLESAASRTGTENPAYP